MEKYVRYVVIVCAFSLLCANGVSATEEGGGGGGGGDGGSPAVGYGGGKIPSSVTPSALPVPGSSVIPALDFIINDGSGVTNNNHLTITFNANPVTVAGYIISLDGTLPYLNQPGILPYAPSAPFVLPNVPGTYTIYVRYYSVSGIYSAVISHQIKYLGGATEETTTSGTFHFTRYLWLGMSGDDVKELQIFLNDHGYTVATTGAGSAGHETDFYGPETAAAVTKMQDANPVAILQPWGITEGTGIFQKYSLLFANNTIDAEGGKI